MRIFSAILIASGLAALCFGAVEPKLPRKALASVEGAINEKFRSVAQDPYDLLGTARGTYLEGYGALFTVELQLVVLSPLTPFHPVYAPAEVAAIHARKMKKLAELKEAMRALVVSAGPQLDGLAPGERITFEAILWRYSWEDSKGLPERIQMSVEKGKLAQAVAAHADPAGVVEVREQ